MAFPFKDRALWMKSGSLDIYGQKQPSAPVAIDCSVISLLRTPTLTSTGKDVSASRGRAGDDETVSKIIVPLTLGVAPDDIIVVPADLSTGLHLRVVTTLPKTNVSGKAKFAELRLVQTDQ